MYPRVTWLELTVGMNAKKLIAETKEQFVAVQGELNCHMVKVQLILVVTTKGAKWNDKWLFNYPTEETFSHILQPRGTYPTGHPLNTIEGKLMFMGAPKEYETVVI